MPPRDSFHHSPIFGKLQQISPFYLWKKYTTKQLCHQCSVTTLYPCAADSALATRDQERRSLGMGAWWYAREGSSTPFTVLSLLSAPSAEKAKAKTFYIIFFDHPVSLSGNLTLPITIKFYSIQRETGKHQNPMDHSQGKIKSVRDEKSQKVT